MTIRHLFNRSPRGGSWVGALLLAVVIFFFGRMLLGMFFSIAFSAISLVIHVAILIFIVMIVLYAIRAVSKTEKAEPK